MDSTDIKEIQTVTSHKRCVTCLLLLQDNRIASCSDDHTIKIYNFSNDFHCDININEHSDYVTSICQ